MLDQLLPPRLREKYNDTMISLGMILSGKRLRDLAVRSELIAMRDRVFGERFLTDIVGLLKKIDMQVGETFIEGILFKY